MGYSKTNLRQAWHDIAVCMAEIHSPYNDGWTGSACKQDLYVLKSWLDAEYQRLPYFTGEEEWEKQRVVDLLKQPER